MEGEYGFMPPNGDSGLPACRSLYVRGGAKPIGMVNESSFNRCGVGSILSGSGGAGFLGIVRTPPWTP